MCFILTKTDFPSPPKHCYFTSDFFFTPSYLYIQFISPRDLQGFGISMLLKLLIILLHVSFIYNAGNACLILHEFFGLYLKRLDSNLVHYLFFGYCLFSLHCSCFGKIPAGIPPRFWPPGFPVPAGILGEKRVEKTIN